VAGPNYRSQMGTVNVFRNDRQVASMRPEKRLYLASREMMTEAGISAGFLRDLYVSLGEPTGDDGAWTMRLHVKPLVRWIWLGALLMAIGGFLAVADRRYRTAKVPVTAKEPGAAAAGERTGTAASESA
jgi:cytochrome c-type biogenesis protein CcmF